MEHKVIQSDCMEYLSSVSDNTFNAIVTSPPYNKGSNVHNSHFWHGVIDYDTYIDDMPDNDYIIWQVNLLNECYRVLKPNGSMFYNVKVIRRGGIARFPDYIFNSNFNLYQMIVWDRGGAVDFNNRYLSPTTELIFWLVKDSPKVNKNAAIYKTEVWKIPPTKGMNHPATFPIELPYNCILLTTDENDIVYDPFTGSGTTGVACKLLNRNFIGTEISENYVSIARKSIEIARTDVKFGNQKQSKKLF